MSRWNARQQALLAALGLGNDWGGRPEEAAPIAAAPPAPVLSPAPQVAKAELATTAIVSEPHHETAPTEAWRDLDSLHQAVRECRRCGLCEGRRQAVPGVGNARAHWMVVGEGPGEQEDLQGEPFVGPSGRLLDAMLGALGLSRRAGDANRQVFIANSVKCRPPGNRNPTSDELRACAPFLQGQLALIKPRIVLALGRFAVQAVLGSEEPIGRLRGRIHRLVDGTPLVVSYHPAYLLRQPSEKARAWDDLCMAAQAADSPP
ncbi:MAG: uracil-DNA glycosylase family protein [Inhella sp.]